MTYQGNYICRGICNWGAILCSIQIDYGKKGIRMDVYAIGETKAFNLEMQAR